MYYLWLNEAQAGPYTLQQVRSMWNEGKITALTLYWQEGQADWLPLNNILSILEPESQAATPPAADKTAVLPPFVQHITHKTAAPAEAKPAPENPEEVLWTGHPTWWRWAGLIIPAVILLALPVTLGTLTNLPMLIALAPLPLGLMIFVYVYVARNTTVYSVTNRRVSLDSGWLTKTSRELRVQDIRSIAAKVNLLGYGDLEFASAASDDVDVVFLAVPGAAKVRDLVKKLQN